MVRLCVSPLRFYAAFPRNRHKFIAFFSRKSFGYGAQERNLIQIMFEGDTGMLGAIFAKRDFANERGFSNNKLCVVAAQQKNNHHC